MLKIAIVLVVFLFWSCNEDPFYYHTVTNHSLTKTVTINFHNSAEVITLAAGESREVALLKGSNIQHGIRNYSPDKRVFVNGSPTSGIYNFFDRESYEVRVLNLTGKTGTLTADGWMDTINFATIDSEQLNINWLLYTLSPQFNARTNDSFPLSVSYNFNNNVFRVSIH